MKLLYDREVTKTVTYRFTINQGGDENIKVSNGTRRVVDIVFVNDVFHCCSANISPEFDQRSYWLVMGAIGEMIKKLELEIYAEKNTKKETSND